MLGMYEIAAVAAAGRAIRVTTEEPALAAFVRGYLDCFPVSAAPDSGAKGPWYASSPTTMCL